MAAFKERERERGRQRERDHGRQTESLELKNIKKITLAL
jgi:hypothetical protein